MKKILLVAAGVLAAIAVVGLFGFYWYQGYGPGLRYRDDRAVRAVVASEKAVTRANAAIALAGRLPSKWQSLVFDETAETTLIQEDLAAQRGYSIDKRRDTAATSVAKDLVDSDASLTKITNDLKNASSDLKMAGVGGLEESTRGRVAKAIAANLAATRHVGARQKSIMELQHDNDVWGFFALCLQADAQLLSQLDASRATLTTGDYEGARTQALAAKDLVNISATWLTKANQELTNAGIYSQDASDLLSFISRSKDAAETLDQASSAGLRQDADSLVTLSKDADKKLVGLRQTASDRSIGKGYAAWFAANASRRLGS